MRKPSTKGLANVGFAFLIVSVLAAIVFVIAAIAEFNAASNGAPGILVRRAAAWTNLGLAVGALLTGFLVDAITNWMIDVLSELTKLREQIKGTARDS